MCALVGISYSQVRRETVKMQFMDDVAFAQKIRIGDDGITNSTFDPADFPVSLVIAKPDGIVFPSGTTEERPTGYIPGYAIIRYNTTLRRLEYNMSNTGWFNIIGLTEEDPAWHAGTNAIWTAILGISSAAVFTDSSVYTATVAKASTALQPETGWNANSNTLIYAESVGALATIDPDKHQLVSIKSYWGGAPDGGGGLFEYRTAAYTNYPIDNGLVFASLSTGRWYRVRDHEYNKQTATGSQYPDTKVNIAWYGAKSLDSSALACSNNISAFQRAQSRPRQIEIPAGSFYVDKPILITNLVVITGERVISTSSTMIIASSTFIGEAVFTDIANFSNMTNATKDMRWRLENLTVYADYKCPWGIIAGDWNEDAGLKSVCVLAPVIGGVWVHNTDRLTQNWSINGLVVSGMANPAPRGYSTGVTGGTCAVFVDLVISRCAINDVTIMCPSANTMVPLSNIVKSITWATNLVDGTMILPYSRAYTNVVWKGPNTNGDIGVFVNSGSSELMIRDCHIENADIGYYLASMEGGGVTVENSNNNETIAPGTLFYVNAPSGSTHIMNCTTARLYQRPEIRYAIFNEFGNIQNNDEMWESKTVCKIPDYLWVNTQKTIIEKINQNDLISPNDLVPVYVGNADLWASYQFTDSALMKDWSGYGHDASGTNMSVSENVGTTIQSNSMYKFTYPQNVSNLTISCGFRIPSITGESSPALFSQDVYGNYAPQNGIYLSRSIASIRVISDNTDGNYEDSTSGFKFSSNKWYNACIQITPTNWCLWVDGIKVSTRTMTHMLNQTNTVASFGGWAVSGASCTNGLAGTSFRNYNVFTNACSDIKCQALSKGAIILGTKPQ